MTEQPASDLRAVPFEEQRQRAIEHYDRITNEAGEWSSFVRDAIAAYQPTGTNSPTCADCGLPLRLQHRYPEGQTTQHTPRLSADSDDG